MKKLFKPIAVLFSAALLLTSCVDNTVSDLVNQIRTNQNALLAARVRLADAQAEAQEITNAYNEAINAIDIEERQSNLDVTLAYNQAELVWAQEELEQAELALQQAIDALEDYLETNGLTEAATYLTNYQTAMTNVFNKTGEIYVQEEVIANLELFLMADPDGAGPLTAPAATFDLWNEKLERDIATKQAELAAEEAALAALEEVAADPATANEVAADLAAQIEELDNAKEALDVEEQELKIAEYQAHDAVVRLTNGTLSPVPPSLTGNPFNKGVIPAYEKAADDVQTATDNLAAAELTVANLNVTLGLQQADLTNAEQLLTNYTSELVNRYSAFKAKENAAKALLQTLKDKIIELDILEAQNITGTTRTAAETAVTTAITNYEANVGPTGLTFGTASVNPDNVSGFIAAPSDVVPTSETDLESLKALYGGAAGFFAGGQPAFELIDDIGRWNENTFIADFELNGTLAGVPVLTPAPAGSYLADIAATEKSIADNTDGFDAAPADGDYEDPGDVKGIAQFEEELADAEAEVAALQDAYDDAVAALPALVQAEKDAEDALAAKGVEIAANTTLRAQLNSVLTVINTQLTGINSAIETKKNDIETTRDELANLEADLAKNGFNIDELNAKIEQEEAKLVRLQEELAVYQAQAASWKALLDAALD